MDKKLKRQIHASLLTHAFEDFISKQHEEAENVEIASCAIMAVLNQVNSLYQLLEVWPESKSVLAEFLETPNITIPTYLNTLLKLPKKA